MINSCNKQGCLGCNNSKSPDESFKAVFLNHFKQVSMNEYGKFKMLNENISISHKQICFHFLS